MIRLPGTIVVLIIMCFTMNYIFAQEINEAEYQQLKNRLGTDLMQKLKEEIKKELIDELKSEYTIEPKQKQVAEKPITTVKVNDPKNESKEVSTREEETVKYTEHQKGVEEIELDKARYRLGEGLTFGEQLLTIRGFGNVNARYRDNNIGERFDSGDNFFSLGEFDLFMTSKLSNRISFLNETVFEFDQSEEHVEIDIERLLIHYY